MHRHVWTIIGAVIIVAVVAGGIWYFLKLQTPMTNIQSSNPEIAGWKTYTDDQFGFQIMYPAQMRFESAESGAEVLSFSIQSTDPTNIVALNVATRDYIKKSLPKYPDDLCDDAIFSSNSIVKVNVNVNGIDFKKGIKIFNDKNETLYCAVKDNTRYQLWTMTLSGISDDIMDKIISTFKFTK